MSALADESIDCCVTDPPYGIRFMGKKWDYEIPSVAVWQELLRVLKPGAHILVACGTRTQHRMAVNIEDAGFDIRDIICWHYGEGFPKSLDVSKAIDKAAGAVREILSAGKPVKRMIPGADQNRTGSWIKDNGRTFTPTSSAAVTEAARRWKGWGTGLKPATELWTLARKPLAGTVMENVIKYGTGAIHIDACRIPFQSKEDFKSATFGTGTSIIGGNYAGGGHTLDNSRKNIEADPAGRFPANVILDEFAAKLLDEQSGILSSGGRKPEHGSKPKTKNTYGKYALPAMNAFNANTAGASRFFYVAKTSPEERGAENDHPTVKPQKLMQYLIRLICPIEAGRVVIDPFAESGSTLLAAAKLGIGFLGYEKDPATHAKADQRLRRELGLFYSIKT